MRRKPTLKRPKIAVDKRVKVHEPCIDTCHYGSRGIAEYLVTSGTIYRASDGTFRGGGGSTTWYLYRCNDPDCPGKVMVRWDFLMEAIAGALGKRVQDFS